MKKPFKFGKQRGVTLVEVLTAVVILSVGLLGVAALSLTSARTNQNAAIRSTATMLISDFVDRMRANAHGLKNGAYDNIAANTAGSAPSVTSCATGSVCSASAMAQFDAAQWQARIVDLLPQGTGAVTCVGAATGSMRQCTITVTWRESAGARETQAPAQSFAMRVDV
jgi:type IV pilus assembly protein PilV